MFMFFLDQQKPLKTMTTLASKLKRKMDEDKTKPIVKKFRNSVDRTSRANSTAAGTTLEKVPVQEEEKNSTRAEEAHRRANGETGQMELDEWKKEKEKMREKALVTDRVIIEERMSEEVINYV